MANGNLGKVSEFLEGLSNVCTLDGFGHPIECRGLTEYTSGVIVAASCVEVCKLKQIFRKPIDLNQLTLFNDSPFNELLAGEEL